MGKKRNKAKLQSSSQKALLDAQEQINSVLSSFLKQFYWLFLIFSAVALFVSVYQARNSGWHFILSLHIAIYLVLVALFPVHRRLDIKLIVSLILVFILSGAVYNLIVLGLLGVGILLLAAALFLLGAFFGIRAGLVGLAAISAGLLLTAAGVFMGYVPTQINAQSQISAPGMWIIHICLFIMLVAFVLLCYGLILRKLKSSLSDLAKQEGKKSQMNKNLQQLVKAWKDSENKYRMLADNMSDLVFVHDMDFNISYFSPSITQLFGYSREEALGLKMEDLMTEDSLKRAYQQFKKYAEDARQNETDTPLMQYECLRRDGSIFWGEVKIMFLRDKKNNVIGCQGILRDISERQKNEEERKALQQRLLHSQKMEAVGQLAGGIAHDFNNQLVGIMGYAEILQDDYGDNKQVLEYSAKIISSVKRAADLTKKLLAFARKGKYQVVPIDIHALISEVVAILKHSIDKNILLRQQLAASPSMVAGDPGQIQNALLNIALNARDAMPAGGELRFETSVVDLEEDGFPAYHRNIRPGPFIKIRIADTGTGFSKEAMKHIFEPFFTTKEAGKGTGMGLAAVGGTIEAHHGGIDVQSVTGMGSNLSIYLPLCSAAAAPSAETEPGRSLARGKGRIMIIEDEHPVRVMLETMLSRLGYSTLLFADGAAAIEQYDKLAGEIDLVLLDFILPNLSGKSVFAAIKTKNSGAKILLCSGYSIEGDIQQLLSADHTGFIQKPFGIEDLSKKIAEMLSQ